MGETDERKARGDEGGAGDGDLDRPGGRDSGDEPNGMFEGRARSVGLGISRLGRDEFVPGICIGAVILLCTLAPTLLSVAVDPEVEGRPIVYGEAGALGDLGLGIVPSPEEADPLGL